MGKWHSIHQIIEEEKDQLISMARAIYRQPELGGEEIFAAGLIAGYLRGKGFTVRQEVAGLKTAFTASYGTEGFHLAFCSEYDALPELGHACGHNLIGIASVAAGVALAGSLAGRVGRVSVIGTPNEEGKGGKVDLVRAGIFDDVDAAMIFHPGCSTRIHVVSLACCDYQFVFHGKNAHAACEPWVGRNALDGVIQTFNAVNALRQHLKDDVRIHGIITEGGLAANIVPNRAAADFTIRAIEKDYLNEVTERVIACARGAAFSTGTELEIRESGYHYDAMISNRVLANLFSETLAEAGYNIESKQVEGFGSIDMGNVSSVTPSIHPVLAITDQWVPGHTAEFSALCDTEEAYAVMLAAGRAMAITGFKILKSPELQKQVKAEFDASKTERRPYF